MQAANQQKRNRRKTGDAKAPRCAKGCEPWHFLCGQPQAILARRTRERDEALAGKTATAEMLRVISVASRRAARIRQHRPHCRAAALLRLGVCVAFATAPPYKRPRLGASPRGLLADLGPQNLLIDPSANFPSRAVVDKKIAPARLVADRSTGTTN